MCPALEGRFLTTGPPGKSHDSPHLLGKKVQAQKEKPHSLKVAELRSTCWIFSSECAHGGEGVSFKQPLTTSDAAASRPGLHSPDRLTRMLR